MSKLWPFLLVLLAGPLLSGAPRNMPKLGPLVLRISFHSTFTEGHLLRLSQVVSVVRDPGQVWPCVAEIALPLDGPTWLTRGTIERRLRDAGLPQVCFRLLGPAVCRIHGSRQTP